MVEKQDLACPPLTVYSRVAITSHLLKIAPSLFTSKGKADKTRQGLLFLNAAYCQVRAATNGGRHFEGCTP